MLSLLRESVNRCDASLFKAINGLAGQPILNRLMVFFTTLGYGWALVLLCIVILLAGWLKRKPAVRMSAYAGLAAYALGGIASPLFKVIWGRPRPLLALYDVKVVDLPLFTNSFPSGHTIGAFAVAVACSAFSPKLGWFLYPLAVLIGFSRVYIGVHYPFDVLFGAAVGALSGWVVSYAIKSRLDDKPEKLPERSRRESNE